MDINSENVKAVIILTRNKKTGASEIHRLNQRMVSRMENVEQNLTRNQG